jgi:CTP:molybdopterin cytidylyltransferase MocA
MTIAALILAAGASRRMGRPKPLLTFEGETFLDRLIRLLRPLCDPVLVVVGEQAEAVANGIRHAPQVRFVRNPAPERGQLSSLQCGLREVPEDREAVLFTPVDYPAVQQQTVTALVEGFRTGGALVVVPTCFGRHGHPVVIDRSLIGELLSLPAEATARDVLHRYTARTRYVEVADEGILRDIDDPEAYGRLLERASG